MSTPVEIAVLSLVGLYATYRNAPNWAVCAFAAAMALGWRLLSH